MTPMITVVDPHHWLAEDGGLPKDPRLRARVLRVAQCIEYGGPLARGQARETLVACRRRPNRTACSGLLWVVKQKDDAIHAFCTVCQADEFLIYEWEDTDWAEGPMEPVDVAAEARDRGMPPREDPGDADERLQRALQLVGSELTPDEVRRLMRICDNPSEVVQSVLRHAKSTPTQASLERLLPALMDTWNTTPRLDLGGRSPVEVAGAAPPQAAAAPGSSRRSVGRNEPCPCGSGKKYKRCCLREAPN
ncbi:MAG: SEC-C metal-binding domain-containing protein [Myxococcales bacterium]